MKKQSLIPTVLLATGIALAAAPDLDSWFVNCDGTTGYKGILADVQQVDYTTNNVYVQSTGIPSHPIGPWNNNPNDANDQQHLFRIKRSPAPAGNNMKTPLGPIGTFVNGVPLFGPEDAFSWQNKGIWNRNAVVAEAISFDSCQGHPAPMGTYHYHQIPNCLQVQLGDDGSGHSPIIGWAFDGYPIYGPYGYDDPMDTTSAVRRLDSGYQPRFGMVQRDTLPDGTQLPPNLWGPNVSNQYPLGLYIEDHAYTGGGDLDTFNGRFMVTPEYPAGTYGYVASIDNLLDSSFPYLIGLNYYGTPDTGNFPGGNINIPPGAQNHDPCAPPPNNYCTTSPNSAGSGAVMTWSGSTSYAANDFVLMASGCPTGQFGLFFYGPDQTNIPLGNGVRCVAPGSLGLFRLPAVQTSIFGLGTFAVDFTQPPMNSGNGSILSGTMMNFQFWYRDKPGGGAGHNLSDGLNVTFTN